MKIKQIVKPGLAVLAAGVLSACATKSNVKADGTTDNPVFPKPYSVTLDNNRGTFPTYDELDLMRPGLTKDDIYKILGRPHYDEGMYGVREWDYLFHFHTPGVGIDPENTSGVEDLPPVNTKLFSIKTNLPAASTGTPSSRKMPPVRRPHPKPSRKSSSAKSCLQNRNVSANNPTCRSACF